MTIANPRPGDILYVSRGLYKHYGIYTGNGKVIHFAPLAGAEINAENAAIDIAVEGVAYAADIISRSNNPEKGKKLLTKLTNYLS